MIAYVRGEASKCEMPKSTVLERLRSATTETAGDAGIIQLRPTDGELRSLFRSATTETAGFVGRSNSVQLNNFLIYQKNI